MEEIACIFCGASRPSRGVIHENGFDARQCSNCGLIFVSPRPTAAETADLYLSDKSHLSARSHVRGYDSAITRAATKYRLHVLSKYVRPGSTIVEIGAGGGAFLAAARREGFDVQGVELNPLQAEFIRSELGIPCAASLGELRELTGRETHDVVYFRDVISHFFDPIAEFEEINAAIAPNGIVAFETGNLADVDPQYLSYFSTFQLPDHLFFFGDATLDLLLATTGFERIATRRWSILPQLRLLKALSRLRAGAAGEAANGAGMAQGGNGALGKRSPLRSAVAYTIYHIVPSRIGAFTPKAGRPQTTLVIARKAHDPPPKPHLSA